MNITICIPTYNRPDSLARVLQHLASFKSPPEEIVIGDNSGSGSAEAIATSFRPFFRSLIYLKRNVNVGFIRNIDSITRLARLPYVYVLSDDDFVYENALIIMKSILDARTDIIAINGGYEGVSLGVVGLKRGFENSDAVVISKGRFDLLWSVIIASVCDSHPLLRSIDLFKYGCYRSQTSGLIPLLFDLLKHGSLVHLNAPIIQHEQRADSISAKISSPEFIDMANSDLEVAASKTNLLNNEIHTLRGRVIRNIYFQGARSLFAEQKFLAGWHSVVRCNTYQGLEATTKAWLERNILPKVLCEKLAQLAADTGCSAIINLDSKTQASQPKNLNMLLQSLLERVPPESVRPLRNLVLLSNNDEFQRDQNEVPISLSGLVSLFELGDYALRAEVSNEMLLITSDSLAWLTLSETSSEPQIFALQNPYA